MLEMTNWKTGCADEPLQTRVIRTFFNKPKQDL